MPSQEAEIMITPKVCCDTKFPLINFAIEKILDLGLHLKLTITDKLFIFNRNHSLHCWKQTTLRSRRPGFRAKQSFKQNKLTFFLTVQERMTDMPKTCFTLKQLKDAVSVQMQHGLFLPFKPTFRSKVQIQNYLSVLSFEHLTSFFLKKLRHFSIREVFLQE